MKYYTIHFRQAFNASAIIEAASEAEALAQVYANSSQDMSIDFVYGRK